MCLIVCAYRYHSRFPLVVSANRDEFHTRPTRTAKFWSLDDSHPGLLAGQDLTQGGTWLGLTRDGRFAAVTNIRTPDPVTGIKSRGFLASEFLLGEQPAMDYLVKIAESVSDYAGFNLLLADQHGLYYLNSIDAQVEKLVPGIYGLSNARLDSDWPKVKRSKQALRTVLDLEEVSTDQLTSIMTDRQIAPDNELPDSGVSREMERLLSASFIANPQREYGTRCTTSLVIDRQGMARFSEQNYGSDTLVTSRQYFRFQLLEKGLID